MNIYNIMVKSILSLRFLENEQIFIPNNFKDEKK